MVSDTITMKPHLPACLFRALVAICLAALSTSAPVFADVLEDYEPVIITNVDQLASYTKSDNIAFIISSDITDSAYRMTGAHQYWTDDVLRTHVLTFEKIESDSDGGALSINSELVAEHLQELSFSHIVSTSTFCKGGAIFGGKNSTINLTNNEAVTFSGNSAYSGGAIYARGSLNLTGNGSVTFNENSAKIREGGAIWASSSDVSFMENKAVTFSYNSAAWYGGAIYADNSSSVSYAKNGTVTFNWNTASSGGAIYALSSDVSFTENKAVTFSYNFAENSPDACGGAIYAYSSTISIEGNDSVMFSRNTVRGSGGAVCLYSNSTINLVGNSAVEFNANSATSLNSPYGGAIYMKDVNSTITLTDNGSVKFSGNSAYDGGAICGTGGTVSLTGNGTVEFNENSVKNSYNQDFDGAGGAICAGAIPGQTTSTSSTISIESNDTVMFSGNSVYNVGSSGYRKSIGGAIYGGSGSIISLTGNGSVTFRRNYEQRASTYRLRSMYADGGTLKLAAGEGQNITFYDTLYASPSATISFNAQYQDKDGIMQNAKGDIVFSGAHAEEDLGKLKQNYTQDELTNSLTTEVYTTTSLYGGRLSIEDGAVYKGRNVIVEADSNATLRLGGGTLNISGYNVTLNAGTTLDLQSANTITANALIMHDDSSLSFNLGVASLSKAALTLNGNFNQGGNLSISIKCDESYDPAGMYMLISMASGIKPETWDIDKITLSGADTNVNHLKWENGVLYYNVLKPLVTAIWSGEQSREWNFTDKNWEQEEIHYKYKDGVDVVFGDIGSGEVELTDVVKPLSVLVENSEGHDYSFTGEGSLAEATALTKRGEGKLTIATANTYTGGTIVEGGTLVVRNSAALGTGSVVMNAGVLDLGGNTIDNNVTTQGEVSIANGGIAGNVSMSDAVLEITQAVTISGKITASSENLISVDAGATLSISQTIANTGSYLEIAGAVDVSNIAGTKVGESSYIGGAVQGNGFEQSNMRIQVISDSKTSRHDISEASFIYKGAEVELDSTCAFNVGETDYTAFYVNSGTESLGTALDGAEAAQVELSGVVMESGTELTVDRDANTDLIQVTSGKATMNIAEGVTLSETGATRTDFILQGAGEYRLTSGSTTLGVTLGNNWKGSVELVDVAVFEDFDLNKYGKAGSVVRMDGASVKLAPSNNVPFLPTLELTGEGMTITGCYAGETYIFAGGVVGDGDFVYNPTSLQHKQTYIFTGDVSQWTGAYESKANKTSTLKFYGDAVEMGAAIKATAGTVNVEVGNGTDAFATTFGNDISASSLKVLDKATATLTTDTTIAGEIEVAGSLKIQGEGLLNVGDAVRMGAVDESTPATLAGVDITSAELSARGEGKAELSGVSITTMEDFKLENVRLDGSFIDIGEDTTFYIKNVEISADTRITDGAARMFIEGGKAFLDESNTEASAPTMSLADVTFYRSGDTETWVTLHENVSLVSLTSDVFTKVMLTGTDLWLDLTGLSAQVGDATAFSVSFEDGALFDVDSLRVFATLNGEKYLDGYTTQQSGGATTLYFSSQIPEPTSSTLSLLALAALAGRRRKKQH